MSNSTYRKANLLSNLNDILEHLKECSDNNKVIMAATSQTDDNGIIIDYTIAVAETDTYDAANPTSLNIMIGTKAVLDRAVSKKIARQMTDDSDVVLPGQYEFLMNYYSNHRIQGSIVIGKININEYKSAIETATVVDLEDLGAANDDINSKMTKLYALEDSIQNLMSAIDGYVSAC
jgi:hypothetical protein